MRNYFFITMVLLLISGCFESSSRRGSGAGVSKDLQVCQSSLKEAVVSELLEKDAINEDQEILIEGSMQGEDSEKYIDAEITKIFEGTKLDFCKIDSDISKKAEVIAKTLISKWKTSDSTTYATEECDANGLMAGSLCDSDKLIDICFNNFKTHITEKIYINDSAVAARVKNIVTQVVALLKKQSIEPAGFIQQCVDTTMFWSLIKTYTDYVYSPPSPACGATGNEPKANTMWLNNKIKADYFFGETANELMVNISAVWSVVAKCKNNDSAVFKQEVFTQIYEDFKSNLCDKNTECNGNCLVTLSCKENLVNGVMQLPAGCGCFSVLAGDGNDINGGNWRNSSAFLFQTYRAILARYNIVNSNDSSSTVRSKVEQCSGAIDPYYTYDHSPLYECDDYSYVNKRKIIASELINKAAILGITFAAGDLF